MGFIDEIRQRPGALRAFTDRYFSGSSIESEQLKTLLREKRVNQIFFTGMGSSLFASYIPCSFLRRKGIRAFAFEANELLSYDKSIIDDNTLVIAVSQSGESDEVIELCRELENHDNLIVVTNSVTSRLYTYGKIKFDLFAGEERHTASKTYTNTIAVLIHIAYIVSGADEYELNILKQHFINCIETAGEIVSDGSGRAGEIYSFIGGCSYIAVIGSGASYSTASHAELVFEEAAKVRSSRYTTGQFVHGPIELINSYYGSVLLDLDPVINKHTDRIIKDICGYGGKVLLITNRDITFKHSNLFVFSIKHSDPITSPILEIIPIELLVIEIGLRKNLQPGVLNRVRK